MQLRFSNISLLVVTHNNNECKDDWEVGKHRDITNVLQSFQPAYRDQNDSATHDVSVLVIAKVLLSLNANNLVQLVAYEDQVSDAKPKLGDRYTKIYKSLTARTKNCQPKCRVWRNVRSNFLFAGYLHLHRVHIENTTANYTKSSSDDPDSLDGCWSRQNSNSYKAFEHIEICLCDTCVTDSGLRFFFQVRIIIASALSFKVLWWLSPRGFRISIVNILIARPFNISSILAIWLSKRVCLIWGFSWHRHIYWKRPLFISLSESSHRLMMSLVYCRCLLLFRIIVEARDENIIGSAEDVA